MERKLHMETIKIIKKLVKEKDYKGLEEYIYNREKEIKNDYIDDLICNLR